jgi:hypothetical protein
MIYSKDDYSPAFEGLQQRTPGLDQQAFRVENFCFCPIFSSIVINLNQPIPTLLFHVHNFILNFSTICRTISHIWKAGVNIPFMSLEANPYIWLRHLHVIGQNPE